MRLQRLRHLIAGLAILGALGSPARAEAQASLVPGSWSLFEWFFGVGAVDGPGFTLDATQRMRLRVTDVGVSGDAFDIFINGLLVFGTPSVPGGVFTGAFDGDGGWANAGLSHGELFLDPGQYTITLALREAAPGFDFGEGFIRADVATASVAPEPATVVTLASGLLGLGAVAPRLRRRLG
jgi:hypothetical protein